MMRTFEIVFGNYKNSICILLGKTNSYLGPPCILDETRSQIITAR